ncbi:MAG: hypothetical protein AAGB16_04425 [Pseudomonadota bacterium]
MMKALSVLIAAAASAIGLFILFYVIFFFLALVGPLEMQDLLSWQGAGAVYALSFLVALVLMVLTGSEAQPTEALNEQEYDLWNLALERLRTHRLRMIRSGHSDSAFIERSLSDPVLGEIATRIAKSYSYADKTHDGNTVTICHPDLAISVSTLALTQLQLATWIAQKYGTYEAWVDTLREGAADCQANGYCHVIFGKANWQSDKAWVNMAMLPFHGEVFKKAPIMPLNIMRPPSDDEDDVRVIWVD